MVLAKAPEIFMPTTCAFVPVELSTILLIILLLIKEAALEEMPV
jgi:hypothetical protein